MYRPRLPVYPVTEHGLELLWRCTSLPGRDPEFHDLLKGLPDLLSDSLESEPVVSVGCIVCHGYAETKSCIAS